MGYFVSSWFCLTKLSTRHKDGDRERAVRAAQSTSTSTRLTPWQKYCLVPPKELLRLRSLLARKRAKARRATPLHLARLFARSLPNEIAWRVLAFWNPRH